MEQVIVPAFRFSEEGRPFKIGYCTLSRCEAVCPLKIFNECWAARRAVWTLIDGNREEAKKVYLTWLERYGRR
jgi:hypothetical protein